tara:strand:+ start:5352 stop:7190 length:1839 start_codon:yes stop_codon:yes gene_type:complete
MAQTIIKQDLLAFTDSTGDLQLPAGTTAQRPGSPTAGSIRYNNETNAQEFYSGTAWRNVGSLDPTITGIDYPGAATAADPAGGESIIITGTNFVSGAVVSVVSGATTTAFNSSIQLTFTSPAKTAGQYNITVENPDTGSATSNNLIQYDGVPIWSTSAGNLGNVDEGGSASFQVTATEGADTIEYAVTTGSLPPGLSLNANTGAITGTASDVGATTTTTFSITATDDENQTSSERSFNIIVNNVAPSDVVKINTWTGNSTGSYPVTTGQNISNGWNPDFVIGKGITGATGSWLVADSIRGDGEYMYWNSGSATGNTGSGTYPGGVTFPLGNDFKVWDDAAGNYRINTTSSDYIGWIQKAGGAPSASSSGTSQTPTANSKMVDGASDVTNWAATSYGYPTKQTINTTLGFSITSIAKSTTSQPVQIPHSLGATPEFVMLKIYNITEDWQIYHKDSGTGYYMSTNRDNDGTGNGRNARQANALSFSTVDSNLIVNQWTGAIQTYMCYAWTPKAGISHFGAYAGNSGTKSITGLGFQPTIVIYKSINGPGSWLMFNSTQGAGNRMVPNESYIASAWGTAGGLQSFDADGFTVKDDASGSYETNKSGINYLYCAFA